MFIETSPGIWKRQRVAAVLGDGEPDLGHERLDGVEPELAEQLSKPLLGAMEVPVVPETSGPARMQPGLVGIDFPRMKVEDGRSAFDAVHARDPPARPPVGEYAEVASAGDRQVQDPEAGRRAWHLD